MFTRERKSNLSKLALSKRQASCGFNELLGYLLLANESTILHKDGALSRHYTYQPPDVDSVSDNVLDQNCATWRRALTHLSDGWMVEAQVVTEPVQLDENPRAFPEIVSAILDDERRSQAKDGRYFKTAYYLSITWKPSTIISPKIRKFVFGETKAMVGFEEQLNTFSRKADEFISVLSTCLQIDALTSGALVSFLYQGITGVSQKLNKPFSGAFLDAYLSNLPFTGGAHPKMGSQYIQVLTIDDLPPISFPAMLEPLNLYPLRYRWSSRFIPLDKTTAQTYLKSYERSWSSKAIGIMGVIRESLGQAPKLDQDAESMAEWIRASQTENSSGESQYGFYNSVIVLMSDDRDALQKAGEDITNCLQQLNFRLRTESVNATEAYLGSIPSHGDYNLRKMLVDTDFVSHAFPTSGMYQGESKSPCPYYGADENALLLTHTDGSRPFWLNNHVGDVGHTAILGPTGSGKSTLISALIMGHRKYKDSRIIVLDKDLSQHVVIKSLKGAYFGLMDGECQLAPLSRITPENEASIDAALTWLLDCACLQGIDATPAQRKLLRESLVRLSSEQEEYKNIAHLSVQDAELRDVLDTINEGAFSSILNGTECLIREQSVIGFDMTDFMACSSNAHNINLSIIKALFLELDVIFQDRKPTLLILEEAWMYLKHPLFREKLTDWFKTLRKSNVSVIFVSQDLSDIKESNAASVIQNSCMTRIYLPNASALEPCSKKLYQDFGLNDRQIGLIRAAVPKRDYYYTSALGNRLFCLGLGELAMSFLCLSSKEDIKAFHEHVDEIGDSWVLKWLEHCGLLEWRDFVAEHYFQEGSQ